ncbi:MAG: hypothetical protein ABFD86_12235 [Bryobacteraceae bacterium]
MLDHLEKLLTVFPFSRLRQGIRSLEVYALEYVEPPLVETVFDEQAGVENVIDVAREHLHSDVAFLVDGYWELWRWKGEWKLEPSPVSIECFGPDFISDSDDNVRLCLGVDEDFLPRDDVEGGTIAIRSNIKGLLRLTEEIARDLPVERRRLWLESGEDLAARMEDQIG